MRKILAPKKTEINKLRKLSFELVEILRTGAVLVVAVENSYVAVADPSNPDAGESFRKLKKSDPDIFFPIFISDLGQLIDYVPDIPDSARLLAGFFWPGMLNIELPARDVIPNNLGASIAPTSVMVRSPKNELLNAMSELMGPIIYVSLTDAKGGLLKSLTLLTPENRKCIRVAIDSGTIKLKEKTSIINCIHAKPKMLREGAITFIEAKKLLPSLSSA
ncbi:MAG: Sua5/YciO/YrdC/YwlC family protein [Candidatus Planktophila sp.]|nr:Sua5/YciO/YrdC/YwlC family protein [Candidatus Planktophila sp.]